MNNFPPGRELNVLVAEKVMGHQLVSNREWYKGSYDAKNFKIAEKAGLIQMVIDDGMMHEGSPGGNIPEYSTDISAAWEVVKALYKRGFGFKIENIYPHGDHKACIRVTFWKWHDTGTSVDEGDAPGAPHAICLAALKTVA